VDRRFYRTGQFARKADVSLRTLRYYDKEGLLAPTGHSESGYRLYTDADLGALQQILALRFLGFALDEIKALLRAGPRSLPDVLAQQKAMMQAKRAQIDGVIRALDETETLLRAGAADWDALVKVIRVIQMEQDRAWVNQYLTREQQEQMRKLSEASYSDEARERLRARAPWTEADQQRAGAQWAAVYADAARLADAGADPAGPEAQDVAGRHAGLIAAFTGGDPEIGAGLRRWWQGHSALPAAQRPVPTPLTPAQQAWLDQALAAHAGRP
jgi:MerR family transcriptional regulator, thiopeptide resistance regulator